MTLPMSKKPLDEFTTRELRKLRALKTPAGVQRFLDSIPYHLAGTAWSPRRVLQQGTARSEERRVGKECRL